jgi:plastocyanin
MLRFPPSTPTPALVAAIATIAALSAAAPPRPGIDPARHRAEPGRIDGTVVLSHALASRRPRFSIYSDPGQGSTPPSRPAPDLKSEYQNVVVYLELDAAKTLAAGSNKSMPRPSMVQRHEQFIPHVLPILAGTTVDFPNEDKVFHNVFSLSGTRTFDLPKYPAGSSRSVTFPRRGLVNVFCHIHSDMNAVILVRDNPYFVSPDTNGTFSLEGIPPGDYTVVAWHERITPVTAKIRIVSGQSSPVTFNIPLPQPADR